jgi:hypothetical protein
LRIIAANYVLSGLTANTNILFCKAFDAAGNISNGNNIVVKKL